MFWGTQSKARAAHNALEREIDEVAAELIKDKGLDLYDAMSQAKDIVAARRREASEKKSLRIAAAQTFGGKAE